MSCSFVKGAWEVRWRDATGRQRSKRFAEQEAARAFDASIHDSDAAARKRSAHGAAGRGLLLRHQGGGAVALCAAALGWLADDQARLRQPTGRA